MIINENSAQGDLENIADNFCCCHAVLGRALSSWVKVKMTRRPFVSESGMMGPGASFRVEEKPLLSFSAGTNFCSTNAQELRQRSQVLYVSTVSG